MDLTIKDIPNEAVEEVKNLVIVAVQRFYEKSLTPTEEVRLAYEKNVDDFLKANNMPYKYGNSEK